MQVKDCMASHAMSISADEPVAVAARLMARYNLGMLPVTETGGQLAGVVTDRDLVLRCAAAGLDFRDTKVAQVMSNRVIAAAPEDPVERAARKMAHERIRRLPVVERGKLVGVISLGDLARQGNYVMEAGVCLGAISSSVRRWE